MAFHLLTVGAQHGRLDSQRLRQSRLFSRLDWVGLCKPKRHAVWVHAVNNLIAMYDYIDYNTKKVISYI